MGIRDDRLFTYVDTTNAYEIVKRVLDVSLSLLVMIVMSPLCLGIFLMILLDSGRPVIFRHQRVGQRGNVFHVYKFRTMQHCAEAMKRSFSPVQQAEFQATFKLQNDPRVTASGRVLRRSCLDELPQFLNVLKGEMSIVGPRPVTVEELSRYGDQQELLLSVRPGITGLWQVSGGNAITYADRVHLDVHYILHAGLLLDMKIMISTIRVMFSRSGDF